MSLGSSQNQTLTYLARRFREAGIQLRTRLGQNFLIDLNLQRFLLDTAQLEPHDVVLEVGTGTGSLTLLMARKAAAVVSVEVDQDLFRLAGETLHKTDNVRLLKLDALKNKNRLNPQLLEAVDQELAAAPGRRFKLVANLPYNVATPILTNLLASDRPPATMTVTIQKELADRIVARPGTKDYGALSIWVQSQCQVRIARIMSPAAFWPRPKVDSAIIQVEFSEELRRRIPDRTFFHGFVRSMFFHRRKYLRSNLLGAFKNRLTKPQVDQIMSDVGLDAQIRGEQLDVDTMLALAQAVQAEAGD
jgi:16S rRNA (adenine1518-N6/adenine1519-N6)-dimethyltransferase